MLEAVKALERENITIMCVDHEKLTFTLWCYLFNVCVHDSLEKPQLICRTPSNIQVLLIRLQRSFLLSYVLYRCNSYTPRFMVM